MMNQKHLYVIASVTHMACTKVENMKHHQLDIQHLSLMKCGFTMSLVIVFSTLAILVDNLKAQDSKPIGERPNVVLILADDLGYGDVSCLNSDSSIPTPNLNQLATQGLTLLDAHTPSAVCTPTRYGLLTGRYCWRSRLKNGVLGGYSPPLIEEGRLTIADRFQKAGYQTAAVGKWHLGMQMPALDEDAIDRNAWQGSGGVDFSGTITNSPIHHGFDSYFGVSASLDMAPYIFIENDRFASMPTIQQDAVPFPHFVRKGPRSEDFVIDQVLDRLTDRAVSFIQHASESEAPFFLYMPLTGPHKPTQPHSRFQGKTELGEYGDFVTQVDWTVGEVLATLDEVGASDNTIVIFTSDNGSYMFSRTDEAQADHSTDDSVQAFHASRHRSNGEFRGTKADVFEAGHHVPMFVRWPGKIEAGSRSKTTVCLTDVYASLVDVLGQELSNDEAEDSWSMLSLWQGQDVARPKPVVHHSVNGTFAIRKGDWKLIASNGSGGREKPAGKPFQGPYQLYNLEEDLSETKNQIDVKAALAKELEGELNAIRDSGRSFERD